MRTETAGESSAANPLDRLRSRGPLRRPAALTSGDAFAEIFASMASFTAPPPPTRPIKEESRETPKAADRPNIDPGSDRRVEVTEANGRSIDDDGPEHQQSSPNAEAPVTDAPPAHREVTPHADPRAKPSPSVEVPEQTPTPDRPDAAVPDDQPTNTSTGEIGDASQHDRSSDPGTSTPTVEPIEGDPRPPASATTPDGESDRKITEPVSNDPREVLPARDGGDQRDRPRAETEAELDPAPPRRPERTADAGKPTVAPKSDAAAEPNLPPPSADPPIPPAPRPAVTPAVAAVTSAPANPASPSTAATRPAGRTSAVPPGGNPTPKRSNNAGMSAANKPKAESPDKTARLDRIKLIQRVTRAFARMSDTRDPVRLKLATENLGSVTVQMRVKDAQVDARVTAETRAAAQVLRAHLPELRQRLQQMNLRVDRLDVESEDEPSAERRQR